MPLVCMPNRVGGNWKWGGVGEAPAFGFQKQKSSKAKPECASKEHPGETFGRGNSLMPTAESFISGRGSTILPTIGEGRENAVQNQQQGMQAYKFNVQFSSGGQ